MSRFRIALCTCVCLLVMGTSSRAQSLGADSLRLGGESLASNTLNSNSLAVAEAIQLSDSDGVLTPRPRTWQDHSSINWLIVSMLFVGFTVGLVVTVSSIRNDSSQPVRLL